MSKLTGTYYTPTLLAEFMVQHAMKSVSSSRVTSVIEPSMGDGVFIDSFINYLDHHKGRVEVTGADIDAKAVKIAQKKVSPAGRLRLNAHLSDFLELRKSLKKVDLVIGNPPYIRRRNLSKQSAERCQEVHKDAGLSSNKVNNLWTSFVVASEALLKRNGVMAFVLPADILQVKYSEEIRRLLESKFERLELFALKQADFPEVEQQTIMLFAYKKAKSKGTFFYRVSDYKRSEVQEVSKNGLMVCNTKWTHYNLDSADIALLNKIRARMNTVADYVDLSAGIVTGANSFFIVNRENMKRNGAVTYGLPIISRSEHVQKIDFLTKDFDDLCDLDKDVFLLDLRKKRPNKKLDAYIKLGEDSELPKRHKCGERDRWYEVPNIGKIPDAFFFKRCHVHPKVIRNVAQVYATDSAYRIFTKNEVCIKSFIQSFYTGITYIYSELLGRKYGGGVLELTPNEFRRLPIIYKKFKSADYKTFTQSFKMNSIRENDLFPAWLISELLLNEWDVVRLKKIYTKLASARLTRIG